MADGLNDFFTSIGQQISNSILPTTKNPEDYLRDNPNTPNLEFGIVNPAEFVDIVKIFEPKGSADVDRISSKLLKQICTEISKPLSHIFTKSLQSGVQGVRAIYTP